MKKILLSCLAITFGLASIAQQAHLKSGIAVPKTFKAQQSISIEPVSENVTAPKVTPRNGDSPSFVSAIEIGSSANAYGYGYNGGQKTMVWADDNLKAIVNIHRMGPGATPPSLSGYLAADKGVNMGLTAADWTSNFQIYNAIMPGATYYFDAARYPQGGIYNPQGNTDVNNAYIHYFAPNLSNAGSWGGYSYGSTNFVNNADSSKNLYWFSGAPKTYIPDGMTIMPNGNSLLVDIETNSDGTTVSYAGNFLIHRGIWNDTNKDYDYTLNQILPFESTDAIYPQPPRIASSPDNAHTWMVTLSNNGGAAQIGIGKTFYPILWHSTDGGLTWEDPIVVQLDGPTGIPGIVNDLLSDYKIANSFDPIPERDAIAYSTAWDCDLAVDKWGNPHIAVIIALGSETDYSIYASDSLSAFYDIYTTDKGTTWHGAKLGSNVTFDGTFGTLVEYNRTQISVTQGGEKVVVTWIDTQVEGVVENTMPDVYARGFDLLTNKITQNDLAEDHPDNVTFNSDLFLQAYFHCSSHYLFTDNADVIVPICTELLSDPTDDTQPVTYYYIPDFRYSPSDFTITSTGGSFPTGVKNNDQGSSIFVNPNPVTNGVANVNIDVAKAGKASISITNMVGQTALTFARDLNSGNNQFPVSVSNLNSGIYFVSVTINNNKSTVKMVVK